MKTLMTGYPFSAIGLGIGLIAGSIGFVYVSTMPNERARYGYFRAASILAGGFIGEVYGRVFNLY